MVTILRVLPIEERIRLVQNLWDGIAEERSVLPLMLEQKQELDRRLDTCKQGCDEGHPANQVLRRPENNKGHLYGSKDRKQRFKQ